MSDFKEINITELTASPYNLFNKDWALLTAGNSEKFNTMTVSWGGVGILWNKNVATVYVRKSRYTLEFIDKFDHFSLTFGGDAMRKALTFCGKNSGMIRLRKQVSHLYLMKRFHILKKASLS